jgi:Uma2 family endonuclease
MAVTEQTAVSPEDVLAQTLRKADAFVTVPGTLEDLYRFGEVKADFIEGLIYLYMAASTPHERIFMRTANKLYNFAEVQSLGTVLGSRTPIDFGPGYHPMPDILFLAKDNPAKVEPDRIVGVPDLVIEILSPSTRRIDLVDKRQLYRQYGVPELYFIDMVNGQVVIDCLKDGEYETFTLQTGSFESRVLPALVWDAAQLLNA